MNACSSVFCLSFSASFACIFRHVLCCTHLFPPQWSLSGLYVKVSTKRSYVSEIFLKPHGQNCRTWATGYKFQSSQAAQPGPSGGIIVLGRAAFERNIFSLLNEWPQKQMFGLSNAGTTVVQAWCAWSRYICDQVAQPPSHLNLELIGLVKVGLQSRRAGSSCKCFEKEKIKCHSCNTWPMVP